MPSPKRSRTSRTRNGGDDAGGRLVKALTTVSMKAMATHIMEQTAAPDHVELCCSSAERRTHHSSFWCSAMREGRCPVVTEM